MNTIFKIPNKPQIDVNDVFNPRCEYNPSMYVRRPSYEKNIDIAFESSMCILIHGQSGTGKSWLTRRMLEKHKIYYKTANLAYASTENSIDSCFQKIMTREKWVIRTDYSKTYIKAKNYENTIKEEQQNCTLLNNKIDYFMEFLKFMEYRAIDKKAKRYIVFENLETILDSPNLIKELSNLITLIDDEEVIKYKTKFIIIGATKDIHRLFSSMNNINTIDNRIFELPEVSTLTVPQCKELIQTGFDKLNISFETSELHNFCIDQFTKITSGIPQRVQELCQIFARLLLNDWKIVSQTIIDEAIKEWITTSLNKNYTYITNLLSSDKNIESYRNQLLYCIAQKDRLFFNSNEIDEDFKNEFPLSSKKRSSTSTRELNRLCKIDPPLLEQRNIPFKEYSFFDFKCALCLRAMLSKENESIIKNDIYDI